MLNTITTALELGGLLLLLAALALVAHALAPAPFGVPAALGVVGVGLIGLSLLLTRVARARRAKGDRR